jgi:hypothetical protein
MNSSEKTAGESGLMVRVQNAFMLDSCDMRGKPIESTWTACTWKPCQITLWGNPILGIAIIQISKPRKIEKRDKNSYADRTRAHKPGNLSIKFKFVLVKLVGSRFMTL